MCYQHVCFTGEFSIIFAYMDVAGCGSLGSNWNANICNNGQADCPSTIVEAACPTGFAILTRYKGSGFVLDGCEYLYYAEYSCDLMIQGM